MKHQNLPGVPRQGQVILPQAVPWKNLTIGIQDLLTLPAPWGLDTRTPGFVPAPNSLPGSRTEGLQVTTQGFCQAKRTQKERAEGQRAGWEKGLWTSYLPFPHHQSGATHLSAPSRSPLAGKHGTLRFLTRETLKTISSNLLLSRWKTGQRGKETCPGAPQQVPRDSGSRLASCSPMLLHRLGHPPLLPTSSLGCSSFLLPLHPAPSPAQACLSPHLSLVYSPIAACSSSPRALEPGESPHPLLASAFFPLLGPPSLSWGSSWVGLAPFSFRLPSLKRA